VLKASRSNVNESKRVRNFNSRDMGTLLRVVFDTPALRRGATVLKASRSSVNEPKRVKIFYTRDI
jgi:hypothetical protein